MAPIPENTIKTTQCAEKKKWKLRAKLEELVKEQHQEVRKLIKVKI